MDPELEPNLLDLARRPHLEVEPALERRPHAPPRRIEPDGPADPVGLALGGGVEREFGDRHDARPQERRRLEDDDRHGDPRV